MSAGGCLYRPEHHCCQLAENSAKQFKFGLANKLVGRENWRPKKNI
jgi:hypothetical protein